MKGQQKISRGNGARDAIEYDFDHDGGRVVGGNMNGTTPRELAAEFAISRKLRPDIEKPVWRNSLSLPAGEKLSDEKWAEIAEAYMIEMGFDLEKTQYVAVIHEKENQQHIHITASRIFLDGTVFHGKNENLLSTKVIAKLEKRFGLTPTKTAEINSKTGLPSTRTAKTKPKKGEVEKSLRTGIKSPRLVIQEVLDSVLTTAKTIDEFSAELQKRGIVFSEKTDDAGKIVGITFTLGDAKFGGSKLGDAYRHHAILAKLESNRNGTYVKNAASSTTPQRVRPDEKNRGTGKRDQGDESGNHQRSKKSSSQALDVGSYPPSPAEEIRLARLTTKNLIVCVSVVPLIPSRKGYRDHIGVDGRVWLYLKNPNQRAGLAFRQNGNEKILEVHRPVANLTEADAEALVRLAVESGMTAPLKIEGDPSFISKITAAARRLNVPVHGDPAPAAPALPDPDQPTPGPGRRMR